MGNQTRVLCNYKAGRKIVSRQLQIAVVLGILIAVVTVFVHPFINGADATLRSHGANQLAIPALAALYLVLIHPLGHSIVGRPNDYGNTSLQIDLICVRLC